MTEMYNVLTLNKIAKIGLDRLGDNYAVANECAAPDAVIVRSAAMHDMDLPESLLAIARAGAGTNNIPNSQTFQPFSLIYKVTRPNEPTICFSWKYT